MKPTDPEKHVLGAVAATIKNHRMFSAGERVLVAVSGGPDSITLLDVLSRLAAELGISLGVAHLNHGLRDDRSDGDARFVATVAAERKLPFFGDRADVYEFHRRHRLSVEDAGRRLRYAFYNKVAREHGWDKTALGHQLDDNAESVLMFMLRGSGLRGLAGIPPVREGKFVRPLIGCTRDDIMAYIHSRRLGYRTDASNLDLRHRRNRIRHQLIPDLRTYNPRIIYNLAKLAEITRADDQWLDSISRSWLEQWAEKNNGKGIRLPLAELAGIPVAAQRRLYRLAYEFLKGDLIRLSFDHVAAIAGLVQKGHTGKGVDLPGDVRVTIVSQFIEFRKDARRNKGAKSDRDRRISYQYFLEAPGEIRLEAIGARLTCLLMEHFHRSDMLAADAQTAYMDAEKARFPMVIRNMQPGDRFRPLGLEGSQKIKKYFIDRKVDRRDRHRYPVLLSRGKIIWLAGQRVDERVKVTPATGRVLRLEFFLP